MLPRILILSGEPEHRLRLRGIVSSCGCLPVRCETISAAKALIPLHQIEVVVCDEVMPDGDFRALVKDLKRAACDAPVIVLSRSNDWGAYLDAMIAGAYDYLTYPPHVAELKQAVAEALTEARARRKTLLQTAA
jgi:DNA-binding NtrC family response regulator